MLAVTDRPLSEGIKQELLDIATLYDSRILVHCFVNQPLNAISISGGPTKSSSESRPSSSSGDVASTTVGAIVGSGIGFLIGGPVGATFGFFCGAGVGRTAQGPHYEHHFLMEYIEHDDGHNSRSARDGNQWEEKLVLHIYEMTSDKGLVNYEVVMTRTREVDDSPCNKRWSITQDYGSSSFKDYIDTGIMFITHKEYINEAIALERAKRFCGEDVHIFNLHHKNSEHFATACFGLHHGQGWCFQNEKPSTYEKIRHSETM